MSKTHILQEIKRTAVANGGTPLGWRKFATETGIKEADWKGKLWARWSDAIKEAGLTPNKLTKAYTKKDLLDKYANLSITLGRLPAVADIRLAVRNGLKFPEWGTLTRQFGGKLQLVNELRKHCKGSNKYMPVVMMCDRYVARQRDEPSDGPSSESNIGYVYLIKHGSRREYKIGRTNNVLRREGEIGVELPEKVRPVHVIKTDDPSGIEAYWHKRFEAKRKNGEWFELTAADVAAFRRRKFM